MWHSQFPYPTQEFSDDARWTVDMASFRKKNFIPLLY